MDILHYVDRVTGDLVRLRHIFVNCYFSGGPEQWVLIDAGLPGSHDLIVETAASIFGEGVPPSAIVLTHGHFDHVGAFPDILETWDVPVYVHPRELPYVTGQADYPAPDPWVGKGVLALASIAYPAAGIDLGTRAQPLPDDGSVPGMSGWRWVATPGHTPGHCSLFREQDHGLIAGDAFVTVQQESLAAVLRQEQDVHGPPAYFTPDWVAARHSVETLAALNPAYAATGHGTPMAGAELTGGLVNLATHFDELAVPKDQK